MPSQMETYPSLAELAAQPSLGQVIWSDVVPEVVRQDRAGQFEDMWWRHTDTDAIVSSRLGNWGCIGMLEVPIGYVPWESIGLLQLDDRMTKWGVRGGIRAITNRAPRGNEQVKDGANGEPYRVATTKSGLVVFASHLSALADLASDDRITSLYEVPRDNSVYDAHEQFRSSMVGRILTHLDELVTIYQQHDGKDSSEVVPPQTQDSIAYVDKFGNIIGRTQDIVALFKLRVGRMAALQITQGGKEYEIPVRRGVDLRSAKLGEITVYPNISDVRTPRTDGSGVYEIIARVDDDPSHSHKTAMFLLQEYFSSQGTLGPDPFNTTVKLVI